MVIALPLIGEISVVLVVLWMVAIALGIAVILDFIAGKLHGLPFPLNQLAGPVHGLADGITSVAYGAIHTSEKVVGWSFHLLAQFWDKLWSEVKSHAIAIAETATIIGLLVNAYHLLRSLVHHSVHAAEALLPRIKTLEREFKGIEHGVKELGKLLAAFGGIDALIKLIHLLKQLEHSTGGAIKGLTGTLDGIKGQISDLKRFLGIRNGITYLEWAAGIVATVIGVEALSSLKCDEFGRNFRNRGCSQWGALDDLLGLLALGILAADFDTLVHEAQDLTGGAVTVFDDVFGIQR